MTTFFLRFGSGDADWPTLPRRTWEGWGNHGPDPDACESPPVKARTYGMRLFFLAQLARDFGDDLGAQIGENAVHDAGDLSGIGLRL